MSLFKSIKWLSVLMIFTIVGIAAFQYYWLEKAFDREERTLERQTNMLFRETVLTLQASKLKLDRFSDSAKVKPGQKRYMHHDKNLVDHRLMNMLNVMTLKAKDSSEGRKLAKKAGADSLLISGVYPTRKDRLMQFLLDVDSTQDSLKLDELDTLFERRLNEQNLHVPFEIIRFTSNTPREPVYNEVTIGFKNTVTYRLELGNTTGFLLKRIGTPILFSIFLIGFSLLSFSLLYRNLLRQRKLAVIKNEFISNITHELKTPIATVSVAIEALRSFNANMDPQRTKEYLDISANELQRLSMLVDKVLKLSMFEQKKIDLKYESLDMCKLVHEVTSSMRLQFEKLGAEVTIHSEGDTNFQGDHLHLISVIFNLMDNALKYSKGNPRIHVDIHSDHKKLIVSILDSGIGIAPEFHHKVFEKFFRVPTGNLHNAKGYGLGLSYVAHVVNRHQGNIKVESVEGNGSRFVISLPRNSTTNEVSSGLKDVA